MSDENPPLPAGSQLPPADATASMANQNRIGPGGTRTASGIKSEPLNLPPIPLNPSVAGRTPAGASSQPAKEKEKVEPKDSFREILETIVFVVVLVLMLKTFLAEAFVIPTGSMADTLLGYHYKVHCKQCGYPNLVNASFEAEPQNGEVEAVTGCQCVNCGFPNELRSVGPRGEQP